MDKQIIYLDYNATTPLLPSVKKKMIDVMDYYGNSSSLYTIGEESKHLINESKDIICSYLGCNENEIIFNSGGSEGNSQAIISSFWYAQKCGLGNHIITSKIEHHSTLNACRYLEAYHGANITYLDVDENGFINLEDLDKNIGMNTYMVSIMGANNEIGTIQDIYEIGNIANKNGLLFHSDCVQRFGHTTLDVRDVDMFSMSAHKIGGPKGVGFLYVKEGTPLLPLIHGTQNNGLRGGTLNTIGIVGLAECVKESVENMYEWNEKITELSEYLKRRILSEISDVRLNGPDNLRLPNNLNFMFKNVRGEELMILLDQFGICVSTGSACNSESTEPSYVLKAIRLSDDEANSSIRISLSHEITIEEINYVIDRLKDVIGQLRSR